MMTDNTVAALIKENLQYSHSISDGWIIEEILDQNCYLPSFLQPYLTTPKLVVDIGAHVGTFTLLAALELKPELVLAVEPEQQNFGYLKSNIERMGCQELVKAENIALWREQGEQLLYLQGSNTGGHSLFAAKERLETGENTHAAQKTTTDTLDHLLARLSLQDQPITLLKIDTEGAEEAILQGAASALQRVGVMVGELHSALVPPTRLAELLDGFAIYYGEPFGELGNCTFWAINERLLDTKARAELYFQTRITALDEKVWRLNLNNTSLQSQLDNAQLHNQALQAEINKKEIALQDLHNQLKEKDQEFQDQLQKLNDMIEKKQQQLQELQEWANQQKDQAAQFSQNLQQALQAKEAELVRQQEFLQTKEVEVVRTVTSLQEALERKDNELRTLQNLLAEQSANAEEAFRAQAAVLQQKETELSELYRLVAEKQHAINSYRLSLDDKEQELWTLKNRV